jgi:hypothetical protein
MPSDGVTLWAKAGPESATPAKINGHTNLASRAKKNRVAQSGGHTPPYAWRPRSSNVTNRRGLSGPTPRRHRTEWLQPAQSPALFARCRGAARRDPTAAAQSAPLVRQTPHCLGYCTNWQRKIPPRPARAAMCGLAAPLAHKTPSPT